MPTYHKPLKRSFLTGFLIFVIVSAESERDKMAVLANQDPLTGVRNKHSYDAYIARTQKKLLAGNPGCAVLMADLNDLKKCNDTYGHEKGDIYLRECCGMLCEKFSHSPVFRVGGDEFVVFLAGQDYEDREAMLAEMRAAFEARRTDPGLEPWERCSVAIGMAEAPPGTAVDLAELVDEADRNMYVVKDRMKAGAVR